VLLDEPGALPLDLGALEGLLRLFLFLDLADPAPAIDLEGQGVDRGALLEAGRRTSRRLVSAAAFYETAARSCRGPTYP
jgi:hypothetical protein